MARVNTTAGALSGAIREYRTAQALARWDASGRLADTARARIDGSVPPELATVIRGIAAEQWSRLGPGASPAHAEVFVYLDTSSIARAVPRDAPARRALEAPRPFDLLHALPEATDGRRCITLVRLRSSAAGDVAQLADVPLLGPCGFFATFGLPGAGVGAWLGRTGYSLARRSDWDVPRAPAMDALARYGLPETAGRCLTGSRAECAAGLRLVPSGTLGVGAVAAAARRSVDEASAPGVIDAARRGSTATLGEEEGRFLADAVRSMGRDRFARFWMSDAAPEVAFALAGASELVPWTGEWVARTYGGAAQRPTVGSRDITWLAIAMPLLIAAAGRRRERVLSERLLGLGGDR
jgi:hypothetical protein